jgi:hypothetical protein
MKFAHAARSDVRSGLLDHLPQLLAAGAGFRASFPGNFVENPSRKLVLLCSGQV